MHSISSQMFSSSLPIRIDFFYPSAFIDNHTYLTCMAVAAVINHGYQIPLYASVRCSIITSEHSSSTSPDYVHVICFFLDSSSVFLLYHLSSIFYSFIFYSICFSLVCFIPLSCCSCVLHLACPLIILALSIST